MLETTFNHHLKSRELIFKNDLQLMKHDTKLSGEYARTFKTICDQLHAIGKPVRTLIKCISSFMDSEPIFQLFLLLTWLSPLPCFADLVSKAESFELFKHSLEFSNSTPTTFTTTNCEFTHGSHTASFSYQRDCSHSNNNSSNRGRTHSGQSRRPPRCQICRTKGHYANRCNQRYVRPDVSHAYLVEAFNTSCSIAGPKTVHWFLDTGASAHMTTDPSILDKSKNYTGKTTPTHYPHCYSSCSKYSLIRCLNCRSSHQNSFFF